MVKLSSPTWLQTKSWWVIARCFRVIKIRERVISWRNRCMPASTNPDLLVRLKEHLSQKVFPEHQGEVWITDGGFRPLLILKLPVEVAGFAVSNGDPKQSFEDCYSDFKKIYEANHDAWD